VVARHWGAEVGGHKPPPLYLQLRNADKMKFCAYEIFLTKEVSSG